MPPENDRFQRRRVAARPVNKSGGIDLPARKLLIEAPDELCHLQLGVVADVGEQPAHRWPRLTRHGLATGTGVPTLKPIRHLPEVFRGRGSVPAEGERPGRPSERESAWITAFQGGAASYGDFLLAGPISDAVNLASISLRVGGQRLLWDSVGANITNVPYAKKLLTREYRPGWEL